MNDDIMTTHYFEQHVFRLRDRAMLIGDRVTQCCVAATPCRDVSLAVLIALGAATVLLAPSANAAIVDLGILPGGTFSIGTGINSSGLVTGVSNGSNGQYQAFVSNASGSLTGLGTLPGDTISSALAINDFGVVTGWTSTSSQQGHAFVSNASGGLQDLGTLLGGTYSLGRGINNSGVVTGYGDTFNGLQHAFVSNASGGLTDLGTLSGGNTSIGTGINNFGLVTGYASTANGQQHAFVSNASGGLTDLGTLPGGTISTALAINNFGVVTGYASTANGQQHAFVSNASGGLTDLGALDGGDVTTFGEGINSAGQIVGRSLGVLGSTAIFYEVGRGMIDLNSLVTGTGWVLGDAAGINDSGQITGWGTFNGRKHAFVLTDASLATVPEPGTLALVAAGLGGLAFSTRRRNH